MEITEASLNEVGAKLDTEVKKLLAQKIILAWILRRNVREFEEMALDGIVQCIEGEPEIGTKSVNPGETNIQITGMSNEDSVPGEGKLYYDIIFYVKIPRESNVMKMIINVEAQKSFYPGYRIETRAVFYAAREISAQKSTEFEKSDYDSIKKVYSIWICMNAPDYIGNAISEYIFTKNDLIPGIPDRREAYDKIALVMITLNEDIDSTDQFINLMNTLISEKISVSEKKRRLEKEYDITVSGEMEGSVNVMCNYSEMIFEKGEAKGMERGIEKGDKKRQKKTAENMLKAGKYSVEDIAEITELSIETVRQIEEEMPVTA